MTDLATHMPAVAQALLGEPNKALSKLGRELRYGTNGSLSVDVAKGVWHNYEDGTGGGVLDFIRARKGLEGAEAFAFLKEIGCDVEDRPRPNGANGHHAGEEKAERVFDETYSYTDESGAVLYQAIRCVFKKPDGSFLKTDGGKRKKTFLQRRPDPEARDAWVWSVKGVRLVPYRLPELIEAVADDKTVYVVEGERKVEALRKIGLTATCNVAGAGKWTADLSPHLAGARVIILPDNDEAGRKHADQVGAALHDVATSVMVLELPGLPAKGDVIDWIAEGGTAAELADLPARPWAPVVEAHVSQLGAIWFHEVGKTKPTRNWLFKNLLLARTFGIAYGPPGCGKSFLVSDMALHGAAVRFMSSDSRPHWFGYKGRPFGTIYVVAEGRDDFEIRLHAWREEHNIPRNEVIPFAFLPTSIDMRSNDVDTNKLLAEIKGLSAEMQRLCGVPCELVVVDTVARVLAGGNENASETMTAFVKNCGFLQEKTDVAMLGVHHGGKEGGRGPRGHEALHGAADFELEVIGGAPGVLNQFVVRKLKAGPGGAAHRFKLRQVKVGEDTDGDAVTSCAVVPVGEEEAQNRAIAAEGFALRKQEEPIFRALLEAVKRHGNAATPDQVKAGVPEGVVVADYLAWRDCYKGVAEPNADGSALTDEAIRKRFRDYSSGMVKHRIMGWSRPWLWWTGRVVRGFPETKPKMLDELRTPAGRWSDDALDQTGFVPDETRTEVGQDPEVDALTGR